MRIDRAHFLSVLLMAGSSTGASAAPLDAQACTGLKLEYNGLVDGGAKADKDRGPEWAKVNLAPERLQKVERLISLEEQLSFRCGLALTAKPTIKEPPKPEGDKNPKEAAKPGDDLMDAFGLTSTPPQKKKNPAAAKTAKKKRLQTE